MLKKLVVLLSLAITPFALMGAEIVGKVQSISVQAKVIQYINPKTTQVGVIKFSDDTQLQSAESFEEFTVNTKFRATVDDKMFATTIKRILVKLPKERVISTDELAEMIDANAPLFIGDARPKSKYDLGHIPGARPTPANLLERNLNWLPEDKATPLVFYCGGVTCPLSPKAMSIAMANGYNNVRAYVEGFPAWKKDVYPAHVNPDWLAQNLDAHHIILDVRAMPVTYIKGAVHLPVTQLVEQHEQWNKEKYPTSKRTIFSLRDKKAPITIVADQATSDEAVEAYEILTYWKFKNVAILQGGFTAWAAQKHAVESGPIAGQLNYVKKLAKGAIDEQEFVKAVKSGDATIIDVRSAEEASQGRLKQAVNIPLETLDQHLEQIPKAGLVIVHCAGGARAALAYTTLTQLGYSNVKFLDDTLEEVAKEHGISLI
ncbi:rhodanese-like domain-containing protein [Vibrio sp. CAU 1672]|uniref:rhodanese-like domain-containing protein n=1 Tax=Vibrio sp. CAU 1672 TaxID=3032594 RepID=UPI0023DCC6D4|nr:rhodanese-like domain-containing protein [Vibrio sp. CAU 1672]MDF2153425.1 rhodanese-like domain-containing protein [Vibrio sp. CAU 1672]